MLRSVKGSLGHSYKGNNILNSPAEGAYKQPYVPVSELRSSSTIRIFVILKFYLDESGKLDNPQHTANAVAGAIGRLESMG